MMFYNMLYLHDKLDKYSVKINIDKNYWRQMLN